MQCKLIKLTNGEDLIAQTDDTCDNLFSKDFLSIVEPVQISSVRVPHGSMVIETYVMQPWLKMSDCETIQLSTKNIIAVVDLHEKAEMQYLNYVSESSKKTTVSASNLELGDEEVDFEDDESENEAFEQFVDMLTGETDEEDDGPIRTKIRRTIH